MKNLILRTLTGAAYVAIIVFCVLMSPYTMLALTELLVFLAMLEYNHIHTGNNLGTNGFGFAGKVLTMFCGLLLPACIFLLTNYLLFWPLGVFMLFVCARMIVSIYSDEPNPLTALAHSLSSIFYIALPLGLLNWIYIISPHIVLALFVMIWLNDTGAYLVGCTLGRHKMFPRVSPKKSWEGLIGGFVVCIGLSSVAYCIWPQYFDMLSLGSFIGLAFITALFATWGDLLESLMKRTAGMKDSGTIMPGHGGILDRIDSLLLVSPAVWIYLILYFENA